MTKTCPRCAAAFECRHGDAEACWCGSVALDERQRAFIARGYAGCLCQACLEVIRDAFYAFDVNPALGLTKKANREAENCLI